MPDPAERLDGYVRRVAEQGAWLLRAGGGASGGVAGGFLSRR
ncbi:hypothetical protein ACWCWD_36930 [Streptomyces sp. NPDC001493]